MNKSRETIIAASLLVFCILSLVLGFTTNKQSKTEDSKQSEVFKQLGSDKVLVVGLEGMIMDSFRSQSPFAKILNIAYVKKQLNEALENDKIKAVLLRMNSPGGTVAASQEVYQLVHKLRDKQKPVVVSMSDVCASGCYYIASAADHIVANPGTLTGSIGVISSSLNFKGLLDKLGIADQTIKAGKYKDLGSVTRPLSLEEEAILNALVADSYDQFLDDVAVGRGIDRAELEQPAQGLGYTGRQAHGKNLVDELGTYEDAKVATRKVLNEKYFYIDADKIKFEETWRQNKLAGLDEIFSFKLGSILNKFDLPTLWMMNWTLSSRVAQRHGDPG